MNTIISSFSNVSGAGVASEIHFGGVSVRIGGQLDDIAVAIHSFCSHCFQK